MSALTRQEALTVVLKALPDAPVIVSLGTTSREVTAIGLNDHHLHVLDSMGLNPAIGLGVALGVADRFSERVLVLEGDGGLLMGLSTLATIGLLKPANLLLVIFDDGTYAATGGQRTASAAVDFPRIAASCGIEAYGATTAGELAEALARARTSARPMLIAVTIAPGKRQLPFYLPDPPVLTDRFMRSLESSAPTRR